MTFCSLTGIGKSFILTWCKESNTLLLEEKQFKWQWISHQKPSRPCGHGTTLECWRTVSPVSMSWKIAFKNEGEIGPSEGWRKGWSNTKGICHLIMLWENSLSKFSEQKGNNKSRNSKILRRKKEQKTEIRVDVFLSLWSILSCFMVEQKVSCLM